MITHSTHFRMRQEMKLPGCAVYTIGKEGARRWETSPRSHSYSAGCFGLGPGLLLNSSEAIRAVRNLSKWQKSELLEDQWLIFRRNICLTPWSILQHSIPSHCELPLGWANRLCSKVKKPVARKMPKRSVWELPLLFLFLLSVPTNGMNNC